MSTSISRSIILCSVFSSVAILSGCSDKKAEPISVTEIDRTEIPTDVVTNGDLSGSNTEWTGWSADVEATNGALAEFALDTATLGSNSLKTSVINVEAESAPGEIYAGPSAVPVKPGQAYGVGAFVRGTRCGVGSFVVHAAGNPENVLAEEKFFFSGLPQSFNYYFQVPNTGVTSVDIPVQLALADNIGGEIFVDKILAVPSVVPPPVEAGNVAPNPGFEASELVSWGQNGPATFTLDTTEAQDGSQSVKIEFGEITGVNPWEIEGGLVPVTVTPGWTYKFSAWIKGDAGAKANFLVQLPGSPYTVYNQQEVIVTSEWQEVAFEATITDTDNVRLYAQYNFSENADKTIYIDNIKLIPPPTCPYAPIVANLVSGSDDLFEYDHVTNGGFEDSDTQTTGWNTQGSPALAAFDLQVTAPNVNKTLVNTGDNALKITVNAAGTNPWDIQAGPTDLFVTPGQTYIYSGYARASEDVKVQFAAALQDAPYTVFEDHVVTFADILWHQITFDFNVPADAPTLTADELAAAGLEEDAVVTRIRMLANMSYPENVAQRIFLDDFTLLPNAAVNGDLEDNAEEATGWAAEPSSGLATFSLDNTQAHTGENSLRVDVGEVASNANLWDIEAGIGNIPVEGGRRYYVSARIKGDEGTRAKVFLGLPVGPYTEYGAVGGEDSNDADTRPDGIALTADWQEITFVANIPADVNTVRLLAHLGFTENSNKAIYLDSFRVVSQIPPPPPPPRAESANMITNGGLENGKTTGWNGSGATIETATSTEGVYSGNFGLLVKDRTAAWNSAQYNLMDTGLEEGSSYLASVWVKIAGDAPVADNLKLTLQISYGPEINDTDQDWISITPADGVSTLGWTQLSGVFDYSPERTITDVKVYVEAVGVNTSYYVDELFLTKVFTKNGNLETKPESTTGWNAGGPPQIALTTAEKHSGDNSLHVTGRTDAWNSAQFDLINTGMQPGRTYQMSAWVKADGATAANIKMTVQMADGVNDDSDQYLTIASSSDTLSWVRLSNTYTFAPQGEVTVFKVYFEADPLGEVHPSYFIDDLVVTEVLPPANIITNGDLELGQTTGWVTNSATMMLVSRPGAPANVHSGNFALSVTERSAFWAGAQFSLNDAGLVEGGSYLASAWVKAAGETPDVLTLTLSAGNNVNLFPIVSTPEGADTRNWTKLSGLVDFKPTAAVGAPSIYVETNDGVQSPYFVDDLILLHNFTPNGGLESSETETTGWNASGAQIALTTTEKYAGNRALHVTERNEGWHSAQYNLLNSGMEVGKTYDISAWVKVDGDVAANLKMTIELVDEDDDNAQWLTIAQSSQTLTWVKLSSRYTYIPGGTATDFKVYFEADPLEGVHPSYYIDNLVITEASEIHPY